MVVKKAYLVGFTRSSVVVVAKSSSEGRVGRQRPPAVWTLVISEFLHPDQSWMVILLSPKIEVSTPRLYASGF